MKLKKWTKYYIEGRDALRQEIKGIEENKEGFDFIVHKEKGDEHYIITDVPNFKELAKKIGNKKVYIVIPNKKNNLNLLEKEWNQVIKCKKLCLIFTNPLSKETNWIVCPYTHEQISDRNTLKQGLLGMSEKVEEIK